MKSNVVKMDKKKKSGSVFGVLMFLVMIIAILLIAFTVYLKTEGYDFSSLKVNDAVNFIKNKDKIKKTSNSEISFYQDGSADCKLYKDYIIVLSKDSIKWYDKSNKLLQEKALTMTRPVLRFSDKYMAVIDISGRDIIFYKDKTQLWTRKLDSQIINAEISDEGLFTVVTQSKEYKSAIQVIDINGVDKYTKMCAQDIVLGAKSIHGGDDVIINKVVTNSIKAGTQFEFNNIYEEKPFASINVADGIFPILMSYGDNEVAIGQNMIVFMDKQGKEVWRKKLESVYCVAPNSKKYIIVAGKFTDANGITKQQVLVLNKAGEQVYSFDQPEKIVGMHLYGDRLALRTQRSIFLYSLKGKKYGEYSSVNEIKDAYLVGDDEAVVFSGATVSIIKIKE